MYTGKHNLLRRKHFCLIYFWLARYMCIHVLWHIEQIPCFRMSNRINDSKIKTEFKSKFNDFYFTTRHLILLIFVCKNIVYYIFC